MTRNRPWEGIRFEQYLSGYDPTGEKARAVKARYVGVCRGCGAYTQPGNGKGDAYRYCKRCNPGAIAPRCSTRLVIAAMLEWQRSYGRLPVVVRLVPNPREAPRRSALNRLNDRAWPLASVVSQLFGRWEEARVAARAAAPKASSRAASRLF